ncbi:MAG: Glu/Leu/Phe/Val dehydrogenase [Oligoflexales bacterium]
MVISEMIKKLGHEQVVFCQDTETELQAIIAIHDTTLGPALGGCRFWNYGNEDEAVFDVLRLSRGMTYKAAVAGLSLGGGKAVIMGDPKKLKNPLLFKRFGRFIQSLNGRYITAEDVNMNEEDIGHIASETNYVTGKSMQEGGSGNPSPVTAYGVFQGINACMQFKYQKTDLKGVKVAVQGIGSVGGNLCEMLHEHGAKLFISDINEAALKKIQKNFGAQVVPLEEIHSQEVDIYAPCALGASLNDKTIPEIKAGIIAGAANNQLLDENKHMQMIEEKQILYAPDYVINAGGLINVSHELKGYNESAAKADAEKIYDALLDIFREANKKQISTLEASNIYAQSIISEQKKQGDRKLTNTYDNQSWISPKHRKQASG